jgi:hypothetical protein
MKINLESTAELAHANGLPVRVWTGATERGTPILALITRVAALDGAGASELERELIEPPTRVVDPSGSTIAAPRSCTVCLARDRRTPARFVARDGTGLWWFECGEHEPHDNLADTTRMSLTRIEDWFAQHEQSYGDKGEACKHDLACRKCGHSIGEIAQARADADPEFDKAVDEAADHAPLVTTVRVERAGAHERLTVWLRGMNTGALTVAEGEGEALRRLLYSEQIVAKARELVRVWKLQDGFNASHVDDLVSEVHLVDSTVEAERRSEAAS